MSRKASPIQHLGHTLKSQLDDTRAHSMADEGGAAAAHVEGEEHRPVAGASFSGPGTWRSWAPWAGLAAGAVIGGFAAYKAYQVYRDRSEAAIQPE